MLPSTDPSDINLNKKMVAKFNSNLHGSFPTSVTPLAVQAKKVEI